MNNVFKAIWFSVLLTSCCYAVDCASSYPLLRFSYVSEDGNDLLNGTFKKYDFDDVKFYAIDSLGTTQFLDIEFSATQDTVTVGTVYFATYNSRWFLEIKGTVTDTLDIKFVTSEGKCCGKQTGIEEVYVNGEQQQNGGYISDPIKIFDRN